MYFGPIDLHGGDYLNKINLQMADFQACAVVEVGEEAGSLSLLPFACSTHEYCPRPSVGEGKYRCNFPHHMGEGSLFDSRIVFPLIESSLFPAFMEVICLPL